MKVALNLGARRVLSIFARESHARWRNVSHNYTAKEKLSSGWERERGKVLKVAQKATQHLRATQQQWIRKKGRFAGFWGHNDAI